MLGISSFFKLKNSSGSAETSGSVAAAENNSMIAGIFSGHSSSSTNVETSGQVASLFSQGNVINSENNGTGAGGEIIFGGGFSGGGSSGGGGGGGCSLA